MRLISAFTVIFTLTAYAQSPNSSPDNKAWIVQDLGPKGAFNAQKCQALCKAFQTSAVRVLKSDKDIFHWARKDELRKYGYKDENLAQAHKTGLSVVEASAARFTLADGTREGLYTATDPSSSCYFGYKQENSEDTPKYDGGWLLARIRVPAGSKIIERGAPISEDPTLVKRGQAAGCFSDTFYDQNYSTPDHNYGGLKGLQDVGLDDEDWVEGACQTSFGEMSKQKDFMWGYSFNAYRIDTEQSIDRTRAFVTNPQLVNDDHVRIILPEDLKSPDADDELKFIATYVRRTKNPERGECAAALFPGAKFDTSPEFDKKFQAWVNDRILTAHEFASALEKPSAKEKQTLKPH